MTKIVYNACFGGFGLSDLAKKQYKEKGGEYDFAGGDWGISRTDPILVQVVEEGKANGVPDASGSFSELEIRDLPPGTKYRIDEYDGNERVYTIDEYDWQTA